MKFFICYLGIFKMFFVDASVLNDIKVEETVRPHIIFIVADDLGWNDVGFHGSNQIPTPNIDALAYNGIILNNYYVNPICTPSRSAIMTGLHPIHTGMQSGVISAAAPYGLPLKHKLLPQYLNDIGYVARAVGKWHLGHYRAPYTPVKRGFLTHFGYWTGHEDYYDHTANEDINDGNGWGYDFRRDLNVSWDNYGRYATDLFTDEAVDIIKNHSRHSRRPLFLYLAHLAVHSANCYSPLQAPAGVVENFAYIADEQRRKFAGMLYKLDESVGRVVAALESNNMLQKSLIVFTTDNGGPAAGFNRNAASNWPLKGVKDTLWEGGVRGSSFLWSPFLKAAPKVSQQMMNIQDWLPTLYSAAGGTARDLPPNLDGIDMWQALVQGSKSPRNLMLHNIDDTRHIQAVRVGDWKLVKGTTYNGAWDGNYGPSGRTGRYNFSAIYKSLAAKSQANIGMSLADKHVVKSLRKLATVECANAFRPCHSLSQACLFNVTADPCEQNNLLFDFPDVVKVLDSTLQMYNATAVPRRNKPLEERADPKYFDYTWTNWIDFYDDKFEESIMQKKKKNLNDTMIHLTTH